MNDYKLQLGDRLGKRGSGVALYGEHFDHLELNNEDDTVECLWVRIKGKVSKTDAMVRVCYRLPNQAEKANKIFYKQLGEVLK